MYKALKNFACNSIRKKEGQTIDAEEIDIMGNLIHKLIAENVIEVMIFDNPKPVEEPAIKQKRKRGPKKKV